MLSNTLKRNLFEPFVKLTEIKLQSSTNQNVSGSFISILYKRPESFAESFMSYLKANSDFPISVLKVSDFINSEESNSEHESVHLSENTICQSNFDMQIEGSLPDGQN